MWPRAARSVPGAWGALRAGNFGEGFCEGSERRGQRRPRPEGSLCRGTPVTLCRRQGHLPQGDAHSPVPETNVGSGAGSGLDLRSGKEPNGVGTEIVHVFSENRGKFSSTRNLKTYLFLIPERDLFPFLFNFRKSGGRAVTDTRLSPWQIHRCFEAWRGLVANRI